jgi:hypothetical protein
MKNMQRGYVDSASVCAVAEAFTYPSYNDWPDWTLWSAVEVTGSLCIDHTLQVAPGPGKYWGDHGLYEQIMLPLSKSGIISPRTSTKIVQKEAEEKTRIWINQNLATIKETFEEEVLPDNNFQTWLDRSITYFWVDHAQMHGGLFNLQFIDELSLILNSTPNDLRKISQLTCDLKQVSNWAKHKPTTEDFKLAKKAYVLSALIRGRYHDQIAEAERIKIMHHQFRRNSFLTRRKQTAKFDPSNTEKYLISMLLCVAFAERKTENRIALWADNLIKARELVRLDAIDLSSKSSDSVAREHIIAIFKRNNFRAHSKNTALGLDVLASLVISGFNFGLCTWVGVPPQTGWLVGPSVNYVSKKKTGKSFGECIAERATKTEHHLNELAESLPGRLIGKWNK